MWSLTRNLDHRLRLLSRSWAALGLSAAALLIAEPAHACQYFQVPEPVGHASAEFFTKRMAPEAKRQTVLLRLPRFEARFNQSVNEALAAAGMPCAFRKDCADFSGIAPAPMKIDRVAHATFLRVDEQGTEAAAATAVTIVATGSRITPADIPRMIVDRPFLVTIRDRASEALIFFVRIADPTAVAARTNP